MSRRSIGWAGAIAVVVVGVYVLAGMRFGGVARPATPTAVVAELFTSEGCSTCPSAEEILGQLVRQQPLPNVVVVGITEHVDYWNRDGWTDPFSDAAFTRRQSRYLSGVFRNGSLFTPQVVVDGQWEAGGNDADGLKRTIAQAALVPKATVQVVPRLAGGSNLQIDLHATVSPQLLLRDSADAVIVVAEDRLSSDVSAGQNKGRTLQHDALARVLKVVGSVTSRDRTWSTSTTVPMATDWKPANLQVIGFLQERSTRRILGAGAARLGTSE